MIEMVIGNVGSAFPDPTTTVGQAFFTSNNTDAQIWTVPEGVFYIHAVCIGAGQSSPSGNIYGKAGGDLRWRNKIEVTPGEILYIYPARPTQPTVDPGYSSYIRRQSTGEMLLRAAGGANTAETSTPFGPDIGGGNGGTSTGMGGGGAGGYAGNGGNGSSDPIAESGKGGGGGGGSYFTYSGNSFGMGGGGTGVHGQGPDGAGAQQGTNTTALPAKPGSYFQEVVSTQRPQLANGPNPGGFGGGAGGASGYYGARGAIRIIWGKNRAFPSLNTKDM